LNVSNKSVIATMNDFRWEFLSYQLSDKLSAYGNGDRISIEFIRDQQKGDPSTNSRICMPTHFGTHIDFPKHFGVKGKTIENYQAMDFVFNHVAVLDISSLIPIDSLINPKDLNLESLNEVKHKIDILIIKTGFVYMRDSESYWKENWGFNAGVAGYLKENLPLLRAIAFDLISLNAYQQREIGRQAHKEFLLEHDIMIIEDVDLTQIDDKMRIDQIIVSPLRYNNAEGATVNIFAKIML